MGSYDHLTVISSGDEGLFGAPYGGVLGLSEPRDAG